MGHFDTERAAVYDEQAKQWPAHAAIYNHLMLLFEGRLSPDAHIGIVGVGTGTEAQVMRERQPGWRLTGIDPSGAMLEAARRKLGDVDLREGTLQSCEDVRDLDAISMIGVLHHLSSRAEQTDLLRTCGERLKPGGLLVFGCHVGPFEEGSLRSAALAQQMGADRVDYMAQHIIPPTRAELDADLGAAGFRRWERLFGALYFEVWAAEGGARAGV